MNNFRDKTFANTFVYSKKDEGGYSSEQQLIEFIKTADRINKESDAANYIRNMVKERVSSAVLYRVFMDKDTIVAISKNRELPASFKVFVSKDVGSNNPKLRLFIDATGLIKLENGYFTCSKIDVLCSYLLAAMVTGSYYKDSSKFTNNSVITRSSATCFVKLFTGVLDNLRVSNYNEKRTQINYLTGIYYLYSLMGKDLKTSQTLAASIISLNIKDAKAYDYYYDDETVFANIDNFIKFLTDTFKLQGLTTDIFLNRWLKMYGSGTLYGPELFPSFLTIITNAYSGAYVNRQNIIENMCGRELVTLTNALIRTSSDIYDTGFRYESYTREDLFDENTKMINDKK